MAQQQNRTGTMGIGALSKATGIPVETLRTWERRYGFPDPERNDAGHRIYQSDVVSHLRLIDEALQQGYRPSNVVGIPREDLADLLGVTEDTSSPSAGDSDSDAVSVRQPDNAVIVPWLEATVDLDGEALEAALRNDWHQLGALNFLNDRVQPFLFELGTAWAERRIEVAHEHFASERLRDFLTSHWRPLSDRSRGARVVCATLPGENHCLGLQMAAMVLAIAGCRIVYLGTDTPVEDIAQAASTFDTAGAVISISVAANRFMARRDLTRLRESLPEDVDLIAGGLGAPNGVPSIQVLNDLDGLFAWAKQIVANHSGAVRH